jgi:hypothetical protein
VKITVIATGFLGVPMTQTVSPSAGQTPVDMTMYTDQPRLRADVPPAVAPVAVSAPRLSISRRPLVDLSAAPSYQAAAASAGMGAPHAGPVGSGDAIRLAPDADEGLSSTFDVPAFLRRQEG